MGMIGAPEMIGIVIVVLVLFGGKKIPELMKGFGKGIKNFKQEMKEVDEVASTEAPRKVESSEATASTEAPKTTTQA